MADRAIEGGFVQFNQTDRVETNKDVVFNIAFIIENERAGEGVGVRQNDAYGDHGQTEHFQLRSRRPLAFWRRQLMGRRIQYRFALTRLLWQIGSDGGADYTIKLSDILCNCNTDTVEPPDIRDPYLFETSSAGANI